MSIWVNESEIKLDTFNDGTLNLCVNTKKLPDVVPIIWYYEGEHELPALYYIVRHIKDNGHDDVLLAIPYLPNARKDRVLNKEYEVFTLKYFCEFINSMGFRNVLIVDPHSPVSPALIDRCITVSAKNCIKKVIEDIGDGELVAYYTDAGALKKYSYFVDLPFAFGTKRREWTTGSITSLEVSDPASVNGKNILIIDDICGTGDTLLESARRLREHGAAKVFVYCTHIEKKAYSVGVQDSELIDMIYTAGTSGVPNHDKIKVILWSENL